MVQTDTIVIFAKAPRAGFAKTRLIPALGEKGAAALAQRMLNHTLDAALDAQLGKVELWVTPDKEDPAWQGLIPARAPGLRHQGEGDLGMRMATAAREIIARGDRVILMGTDCPAITAPLLQHASQALNLHDVVIHPTTDGGYALLGLRQFSMRLFQDIAWSTDTVAMTTLCRIRELGWSVKVLQALHDIDTADDLRWLPWPVPDFIP